MLISLLLWLLLLLKKTIDWLNSHCDRANDVEHVEKSDRRGQVVLLRQIVDDDVLYEGAVRQVRETSNHDAYSTNKYVGYYSLSKHGARFILLWVDVQQTGISFKNTQGFAHKEWEHGKIEVLILKCFINHLFRCNENTTIFVWVGHGKRLALCPQIDRSHLKDKDEDDRYDAA